MGVGLHCTEGQVSSSGGNSCQERVPSVLHLSCSCFWIAFASSRVVYRATFVFAEMASEDTSIVLTEADVPGASLQGRNVSALTVNELKRWLACRGAGRCGNKAELVKR